MDLLKLIPTTPSVLVFFNCNKEIADIILAIDISLEGQKEVFMQLVKKKKHLLRYESRIWSSAKKKYNVTKQEC